VTSILALVVTTLAAAQNGRPVATELQVKAAFLLNFAAFVEWPAKAFADEKSPVVVGLYGVDPFGAEIDEVFQGESVRGRAFTVRRIPRGGNLQGCHILFIADSERRQLPAILSGVSTIPVLTVGNGPGFCDAGGVIEFVMERGRVRFRINQAAAQQAELTLSSKLLRLAQ
jgi:hypothetical protein